MRAAIEMPFDVDGKRGWIYYVERLLQEFVRLGGGHSYLAYNFFFSDHARKAATFTIPDAPNVDLKIPRIPESFVNWAEWTAGIPLIETWLKGQGADVCHAMRIPRTPRVPVVFTNHDIMYVTHPEQMYPTFKEGWEKAGLPGMRLAARIICHSHHHKKELIEVLGLDERRIHVIETGANTDLFHPIEDENTLAEVRRRLNLPERFVMMIGSFDRWWCEYDNVLRAFKRLTANHDDLKLVMVGGASQKTKDRLLALGEELKISNKLIWVGKTDLATLTALCTLALCNVYPARDTGCSINVLDSMAAGLPVVTGKVSLLPEMLGDAGVWADPQSPEELTSAIASLVENPEKRSQCSKELLRRARARTWQKTARETLSTYQDAAGCIL